MLGFVSFFSRCNNCNSPRAQLWSFFYVRTLRLSVFLSDHQNKQKNHDKKQLFLLLIKLRFMHVFHCGKHKLLIKCMFDCCCCCFFGKCTLFSTCFYGKMMLFVLIGFNHVAVIGGAWNESFSLSLHHHCDVWYCLFCLRQRCDMDAGHETQYMFINLTRFKTWNHWIRIILTLASDLLLILELRM